jgi:hypothetical protein
LFNLNLILTLLSGTNVIGVCWFTVFNWLALLYAAMI